MWAAGVFYRVERLGPELPHGPVIVVVNHPNMLMDPLLALRAAGRRVRVLAKAPLFELPLFGQVLRSLDTLPLYRVQDDPKRLHRNLLAFREAVETLSRGGTLLTFPEGKSHSSPALAPLKTGAARVALEAEEASDWRLGVKIVPVGLVYQRKQRFRSRAVVGVGEGVEVSDWREPYRESRMVAARSLTAAVASALRQQTLNLSDESHRELVVTADLLYARAKGWAGWRERESLGDRLPRLQRLAEQFAWLRANDPGRLGAISGELESYARNMRELGVGDAEAPPRYTAARALRYAVREGTVLGLAAPLAALGTIAWCIPHLLCGFVSRLMKPPIETIATVQLLAGIALYPAAYLGWVAVAIGLAGPLAGLGTALALPFLGYAALLWHQRRNEVFEDVRLFWQVVRHPEMRERLAEQRAALVADLDSLGAEWSSAQASTHTMAPTPTGKNDE
jgi:glycerol-3-phosphate O-acyltransferase/dihydroxyacetone phosphate acyltransferase